MQAIRLATPEEVEGIKAKADLSLGCTVLVLESPAGKTFAVLRQCWEIDPVIVEGEDAGRRKAMMFFGLETGLNMLGVPEYYFNINATDEAWQGVVKNWGAEQVSEAPELRFKKVLKPNVN